MAWEARKKNCGWLKKKLTKIVRYRFYKSEQINNKCDIIKYDDFDFYSDCTKNDLGKQI